MFKCSGGTNWSHKDKAGGSKTSPELETATASGTAQGSLGDVLWERLCEMNCDQSE